MKKIGIVTLNGNYNYGNRLQNYALKKYLENNGHIVDTIWFCSIFDYLKMKIKKIIFIFINKKRNLKFIKFSNKYLNIKYNFKRNISNNYDYFVVGSDQVWNYTFPTFSSDFFLPFSPKCKNISYAASFGISELEYKYKEIFRKGLSNFLAISVREDKAKEIINELDDFNDVEVLVDPTLLLTSTEWEKIMKKPTQIFNKKYILNYFLGELSEERKKQIDKIAKENDCIQINLLNKEDNYYTSSPEEFLYLEKNAFLICTDSFHSSVFAFIFDRPFIVFDREDNEMKMGSRIDTLLHKFKLNNRKFSKSITLDNLVHDYSESYLILEKEREKSKVFFSKYIENKILKRDVK